MFSSITTLKPRAVDTVKQIHHRNNLARLAHKQNITHIFTINDDR
jgi:hypothetical protein